MGTAINGCINCTGYHPNQIPTIHDFQRRMCNPAKDAWIQLASQKNFAHLYKNKSCSLCGRTYDENGDLDVSWKMTARRVKEEFRNAGINLDDDKWLRAGI